MIALVDCNNFFASCERLFRPDLMNKPVLVLSNNDGCVVARSNEVRELGVPMGVPYFKVKDIVEKNNIQCFSSNFALYSNISQRVFGVLQRYVERIEIYSIDEAFMQLDSTFQTSAEEWGQTLSHEVAKSIGIPVSVGIAPTKTLAKLASSYAKKQGKVCVLDPQQNSEQYQTVLTETPVGNVWGIGRRLAPRFLAVGIHNAWQLSNTSEAWLHSQLGITGTRLSRELKGIIAYPFEENRHPQKTLMVSRSFGHTIKNIHELETAVASFASQAAFRLRTHKQTAGTFGLYLRYRQPDGSNKGFITRVALPVASNDTPELVHCALTMLSELYDSENGYKKAGVFASSLQSSQISQTHLFDFRTPYARVRQKKLMNAVDTINQRFGSETIYNGSINPQLQHWRGKKERMSPAYTTDWRQLPLVHPLD